LEKRIVTKLILRFRGILIALTALALSAGLAFGAQPDAAGWGLSNAASHAGKIVPVQADEDTDESVDEDTDETTEEEAVEEESAEDAGENCTTDPTTLTPDQLDAARHGSIVCWAAHQTDWPEWFSNHGAFVSCWAHQGKADAPSCTEAPVVEAAATTHGKSQGKGKGKGHNK
jgi:hypothetical protein